MFDSIHTGWHCGQVKCFGRTGRDYRPGDRVRLEVASVYLPRERSLYDSLHEVRLDDFQVIMDKGLYLLVRHGRLIQVSARRDWRFAVIDNQGLPYDERVDILIGGGPVPPPLSTPIGRVRHPGWLAPAEQVRSCRVCAGLRLDSGGRFSAASSRRTPRSTLGDTRP